MKNILLISNIYPNNDPEYIGTKVCHTFAKEWVAMGYNIRVVHFDSLFPRPYYWVGRLFNKRIQAKTGAVVYTRTPRKPIRYMVEGVSVVFVPLRKYMPHRAPSQRLVEKAFQYVVEELKNDGFKPDIVTAHFVMPQLQFLPLFKKHYPATKTCLVLHGNSVALAEFYPKNYQTLMLSIDVWGFRSLAFEQDFKNRFGSEKPMFICYSGIPEKYLEVVNRDFNNGVKKFVFVGSLYELKNVDITLRALHKIMDGKEYTFDIVGNGAENGYLHHLVNELGISDHVVFHGQMNRDKAQQVIRNADCFVMVSSREAFGLVYLEAMAKGCIVIGTKGQGIEGIVKHGENGFLCKARDVNELAEVLNQIINLPQSDLLQISSKAVKTASNLTDRKVAEHYINSIINL